MRDTVVLVVAAAVLSACAAVPLFPVATATPVSVATLTPVPPTVTPTATPVPPPTPTPTPAPTIDPTCVATVIAGGQGRLSEAGIQPLCLRHEDADGDGAPEWIGLYLKPSEPPRLGAFVIDGDGAWYELLPVEQEKYGLGEHGTCELEVRDINADQKPELLVWGRAGTSTVLLHVYAWNGAGFSLVAPFEGNAGIRLENGDGDLAEEVVVGYRKNNDLVWEVVHTWDGSSYAWTWDRHSWYYLDRPHAYSTSTPDLAVISFYLAIDDRDLPAAYQLLSVTARNGLPYETWGLGYITTVGVEAGGVHEASRSGEGSAVVAAQVRSYDNVGGRIIGRLWEVEWTVTLGGDGWRLESANVAQLDEWELLYYR